MSKYHRINWRESDTKELNRVVRNFNAKVNRLIKQNPQMENVLPEKIKVGQLKELINTRQDLKREINSLKRFSKRGSEEIVEVPGNDYNLKITKWQRAEMNRRVSVINRRRAKRLEELSSIELTSRGNKLGYKLGDIGMGRADEVSLSPMNAFTRRMGQRDLKKKWDVILRESQTDYFTKRDYDLRDNAVKAITENYNVKDVQDVIDHMYSMDIKDWLQTYYKEDQSFEFYYPPNAEQYQAYVSRLKSAWLPER